MKTIATAILLVIMALPAQAADTTGGEVREDRSNDHFTVVRVGDEYRTCTTLRYGNQCQTTEVYRFPWKRAVIIATIAAIGVGGVANVVAMCNPAPPAVGPCSMWPGYAAFGGIGTAASVLAAVED